jgi:hypothetical protein
MKTIRKVTDRAFTTLQTKTDLNDHCDIFGDEIGKITKTITINKRTYILSVANEDITVKVDLVE